MEVDHGPPENAALRYWYDKACLNMAMFQPPVNPLSYRLSGLLRHSKALRHTLQCVADAHREHFVAANLTQALQERNLAIVSLQAEVARVQTSPKQQTLLRTMILASLVLCVSSGWLDPSGREFGMEFLFGVKSVIHMLCDSDPDDAFAFYVLGLFLYWEAFSSYLIPCSLQQPPSESVLRAISRPPFNSSVHPVTGIATTLCPLLTGIGQHYRRAVETRTPSLARQQELELRLEEWRIPEGCPRQPQLLDLAERYRDIGVIMLYQARAAVAELDAVDALLLHERVLSVMETLKHVPREDPLINWIGPFLLIAGSELPATCREERRLVETSARRLATWTRIPAHGRCLEIIRKVWQLRDIGLGNSWLDVMIDQGLALAVG
ncbi:hypothetical protein DBV05_g12366 [Lasiodiplodia theobromae]|uniref:Uncharacterized protein n=1 Tax=Lasiodiplodia theobromae TaxID=45133 RepID=A0A5N5CUC7_9PEZI|nr:hypothetical protein DBV05_g12366 [Lasiodiplodia theobromae]